MPMLPVRNLAAGGIVTDANPLSLEVPYWTQGRNVVFENGKALRSPIWRDVSTAAGPIAAYCTTRSPTSGFDQVVIASNDASISLYANGSVVAASETGFVPTATGGTQQWSSCFLGDVLYINRSDLVPRALLPSSGQFAPLPNWPTTWRANVIRQYQEQVIALGVTQSGVSIPSQINVSDIAYFGAVPDSWDTTNPTLLAYSNQLSQLDGPILDGLTLRNSFLFYTKTQTWLMTAGASTQFAFQKLFSNAGVINQNCIVEVNGLHYVFGINDCYVTDGQTKTSLLEGRCREWVYRTMNKSLTTRFFATYLPQTNEIMFAYVSGDPACAWTKPTGCNSAVTVNLTNSTTSFVDLPNVTSMTQCNVDSVLTWASAATKNLTWAGVGGSWYDQQDSKAIHTVAVNQPLPASSIAQGAITGGCVLGYDFIDRGQLSCQADVSCLAPSFVQRTGLALDFPDEGQQPLQTAKTIRGICPEITISRPVPITIQFSASMTPTAPLTWGTPISYDPTQDYRVDVRDSGRFLAIQFTFQPLADTEVSGFDIDMTTNGRR